MANNQEKDTGDTSNSTTTNDDFAEEDKGQQMSSIDLAKREEIQENNNDAVHHDYVTEDGRNAHTLICQHCGCKVLLKKTAQLIDFEVFMPLMMAKNKTNEQTGQVEGEHLKKFWKVQDMYAFENVGFTNTIESGIKYLICADCEIGPIGWHNINDRTTFLIAVQRIEYSD